jgi:hypothetical protein
MKTLVTLLNDFADGLYYGFRMYFGGDRELADLVTSPLMRTSIIERTTR